MKPFLLAFALGVVACLILIGGGLSLLGVYYGVGPHNIFVFNDEHLQSIYIVKAPEDRTRDQAQNLMDAHMIVLSLALAQETEVERVYALSYWASVMMCGMNPLDKRCLGGALSAVPGGQRI